MRRTVLPRTGIEVSRIGLAASRSLPAERDRWRSTAEFARRAGVNLFDLSSLDLLEERYFRTLLEGSAEPCSVIVGRSSERILRAEGGGARRTGRQDGVPDLADAIARSVAPSAGTEPGSPCLWVEWDRSPDALSSDATALKTLDRLTRDGSIGAWSAGPSRDGGDPGTPTTEGYFQAREVSLLNPLPQATRRWEGLPLLARNPWADGRLDGSRFDASAETLSVGRRPIPLGQLQEEFAPVLRLAPLAQTGRRTLAQAALRYLLDVVGAFAIVVPPPASSRLPELLAFEETPPLTPADLALVEGLPPPSTLGPPTGFSAPDRF